MARVTRSSTQSTKASKSSNPVRKTPKSTEPGEKTSVKVQQEQKQKQKSETEGVAPVDEEEFQLPSDDSGGEETDSELVIHEGADDQDVQDSSENVTRTSQSGHTVIKPGKTSTVESSARKGARRGVIYIGRLPHGFEEKELRRYFQQFGEILRLRLSRNKKTGNSKHYAFLEFKEYDVAKIAAETMNNYLLMGHLLKCSLLEEDKIHEKLFVGANLKFKKIPFAKINQLKFDRKKDLKEWERLQNKHEKNISSKKHVLARAGIDYNIDDL
ncbi:hypothetical protein CAS74_004510 [Pichia kudriavzevii]|uniref:RRM domain-containing protein n=1 Tax=Pichia kudriavzevii TaxID=4909 RepID=A0A099P443_PICKU|nr:hypothetical protein JL09_g1862 [Pichia kudriavzevii]OUT20263.1 hypothetical protein CAS74_004510 [Pichia kudriavzevii]